MSDFDYRRMRISIDLGGDEGWYVEEDLAMEVTGVKYNSSTMGACVVQMTNLPDKTAARLATESSNWGQGVKVKRKIKVEAGRVFQGMSTLFEGNIWLVNVGQPPDIITTLDCRAGIELQQKTVVISEPDMQDLSVIAQRAADEAGLVLAFEVADKKIGSFNYSGSAFGLIEKLRELGAYRVFMEGGELVILDIGKPRARGLFRVDPSNLVGVPQLSEVGVDATIMFSPGAAMGLAVEVESRRNAAANGSFYVYKIGYHLANRANPWTLELSTSFLKGGGA